MLLVGQMILVVGQIMLVAGADYAGSRSDYATSRLDYVGSRSDDNVGELVNAASRSVDPIIMSDYAVSGLVDAAER